MDHLRVRFDTTRPIHLWLLSDLHIGHQAFDSKLFASHKEIAKTARAKVIFLGDAIEAVTTGSTVANLGGHYEQEGTIQDQLNRFIEAMKGLRVLSLTEGNHERRITRVTGYSILTHAAADIGRQQGHQVTLFSHGGRVAVTVGATTYHLAVHHGEGGPSTFFRGMLRDHDKTDLIGGGHTHQLIREDVLRHSPLGPKQVICLRTGSYLPLPNYAREKIGSNPIPAPGSWLVSLYPGKRRIEVRSLGDLAQAREWVDANR